MRLVSSKTGTTLSVNTLMSISSCVTMPHLLRYEATCLSSSCPEVVDTVVARMPTAASPAASLLTWDTPTSHLAGVMAITRVPIPAIYASNPHMIPFPTVPGCGVLHFPPLPSPSPPTPCHLSCLRAPSREDDDTRHNRRVLCS